MILIQQFTKLPVFRQLSQKELKKVKEEKIIEENNLNEVIFNEEIESLKKEISKLEEELNLESNKKNSLEQELELLKDQNEKLKNSLTILKENVKGKLGDGTQSSKDLISAKYKVIDLEKKLMDVQIELARLKKERNPLIKK